MLLHPQIDPIALQLGPLAIHWYGLTYLAAFALFVGLARLRLKHEPYAAQVALGTWSKQDIEDILFYGVMGVILGGRIGYCLFYNPGYYLEHPLEVLAVWQGGMSFHGGMLGVFVATAGFAWQRHRAWLWVTDFIAPFMCSHSHSSTCTILVCTEIHLPFFFLTSHFIQHLVFHLTIGSSVASRDV